MWWKILIGAALYLALGVITTATMFDYPVGPFWRIIAVVLWPVTMFFR